MKRALLISLCANGALLCVLALKALSPAGTPAASGADAGADESLKRPAAAGGPEQEGFHWSQIESSDYRVFVSNLRGIGCPEQTIRDIISADLHSVYARRIARLEQEAASADPVSRDRLESDAGRLKEEEPRALAALLGDDPSSAAAGAAPAGSGTPASQPSTDVALAASSAPAMPLIFQTVDISSLDLNLEQMQAIEAIRMRFLDDIGGSNQDPNDPEYRRRWIESQPAVDDEMRGMIGADAFQEYQLKARESASSPAPEAGAAAR
jgi:hypothetical protein